jgi:hypothetical protein
VSLRQNFGLPGGFVDKHKWTKEVGTVDHDLADVRIKTQHFNGPRNGKDGREAIRSPCLPNGFNTGK